MPQRLVCGFKVEVNVHKFSSHHLETPQASSYARIPWSAHPPTSSNIYSSFRFGFFFFFKLCFGELGRKLRINKSASSSSRGLSEDNATFFLPCSPSYGENSPGLLISRSIFWNSHELKIGPNPSAYKWDTQDVYPKIGLHHYIHHQAPLRASSFLEIRRITGPHGWKHEGLHASSGKIRRLEFLQTAVTRRRL